jgi:hypothetical protein
VAETDAVGLIAPVAVIAKIEHPDNKTEENYPEHGKAGFIPYHDHGKNFFIAK